MAAGNMLRVTQTFSLLNIHPTPWSAPCRCISNRNLLEKLGLPEKPKRPNSPFLIFRQSVKQKLLKQNPNMNVLDVSRMAAKLWREQSKEEIESFSLEFQQNFQKYKSDLEKYYSSLTPKQKEEITGAETDIKILKEQRLIKARKERREKELNKPKYPMKPFFKFVASSDSQGIPKAEFVKIMAEKWRRLPENVKQKYKDEFKKQYDAYLKDLEAWEEKMIKQGNIDLVRTKILKQKLDIYSQ